jgi:C-terminal processing protease CtpA/Prc
MRTLFAFLMVGAAVIAPGAVAVTASELTTPAPMSPEAKAYVDQAIALFREQHINSAKMDWPALARKVYAAASGARSSADTYPAIRLIINELGEKHTNFIEPDRARANATGHASGNALPPPLHLPEVVQLANRIGAVRLYGFAGSPEQGTLYAQTGRAKIDQLKTSGACRFILDLRQDTGGNMYPMLTAVGGLLGDGVLGSFEDAHGNLSHWLLKNGQATSEADDPGMALPAPDRTALPLAVLIGPMTMSAGEFTAMSFEGRANTRFFGSPTGGFVTANHLVPLSDGAEIVMTVAWGMDRTGKKYVDRIVPDEETGDGPSAESAAVKWLSAQPCHSTKQQSHSATRR